MSAPAVDPNALLTMMRRRRVCRSFTPEPVPDDLLRQVAESARWATSAGNRLLHKFLVVRDPAQIALVHAVSPGMSVRPPAMILILTDEERAAREATPVDVDHTTLIDVGTAAMTMTLMATALGLGSCPVTSFSASGVATILDLPPHLTPQYILILGWPAPAERVMRANAPKPLTARDLTYWERAGQHDPES